MCKCKNLHEKRNDEEKYIECQIDFQKHYGGQSCLERFNQSLFQILVIIIMQLNYLKFRRLSIKNICVFKLQQFHKCLINIQYFLPYICNISQRINPKSLYLTVISILFHYPTSYFHNELFSMLARCHFFLFLYFLILKC